VLSSFDDYPIHPSAEPIAHTASGDRNHYDRYWFNGYQPDGSLFFAIALGLYPNREVMDAAISVVHDGVQTSVHASRRAPLDRSETAVGPITLRVDEPLRRITVTLDDNESGITGSLTFVARTAACEEPRFTIRTARGRIVMDYTRLTQFGTWDGSLVINGAEVRLDGARGTRDRSWGIRPVGERDTGAPGPLPQFFWLWAPVHFDDVCTHFDVQEDARGRRSHAFGIQLPILGGGSSLVSDVDGTAQVAWDIAWKPGTRRSRSASITIGDAVVHLQPILDFQMCGIGYLHPAWGHGLWKGEEAVGVEAWKVDDIDPMAPQNIHVQQLCRATMGDRVGIGVLEQLVVGPHAPAGFADLLDPAP
jgi:hypothetical protein